jgi:hypothetical protein
LVQLSYQLVSYNPKGGGMRGETVSAVAIISFIKPCVRIAIFHLMFTINLIVPRTAVV